MKRFAVALSLFLLVLGVSATGAAAGGKKKVLNAQIDGSTPNVMIRSVLSGGAPWVVKEGKATLDASGHLKVKVKGLLIASGALASGDPVPDAVVGTVGPVTMVAATLTCGGPGGGTPFTLTSTAAVPLSPEGDFEIDEDITLPTACDRPIILITVPAETGPGIFIAVSTPTARSQND